MLLPKTLKDLTVATIIARVRVVAKGYSFINSSKNGEIIINSVP